MSKTLIRYELGSVGTSGLKANNAVCSFCFSTYRNQMPKCRVNNIELFYEVYGEGEPLLFLHGLGSNTQDWEKQLPIFAEKFKVYLVDLRGHGQSEKPECNYSLDLFAQDINAFIKDIINEPVNLVGLSLGAIVACVVAANFQSSVKSLTLVNCPAKIDLSSLKTKLQYCLRISIINLFGMKAIGHYLAPKLFPRAEHKQVRELFIQRWEKNDKKAYIKSMKATLGWNIFERIDRLQCPVAAISAKNDYFPVADKNAYLQKLNNAQHIVIQNTHHALPFEDPQAFNKALHDALKL